MSDDAPPLPVEFVNLTTVARTYLKVIWMSQEWRPTRMSTKLLASSLSVTASTVSETIRKLAAMGLVHHRPYGAIGLTEAGRVAATYIVRRQRLLELFLVEQLGYGWDEVAEEAACLESSASDKMIDSIDAVLGYPTRDPHGDPIPRLEGEGAGPQISVLSSLQPGASGTIARVSESSAELLRYFDAVGIGLGKSVTVCDNAPVLGTVTVRVEEQASLNLGYVAAESIWLVPGGE
ncbi:metal-dependent transcriptional regulator [Rhodococcoides yunnanense]|uniref:metal-dependent transcriptional regulator n=1 Tax=Rhodococcoides yunnanense TaxID=278209 RepID=UPI000932C231|nr:metal-dependent transcriptional regulator [Rhodococcus yunnanensis]